MSAILERLLWPPPSVPAADLLQLVHPDPTHATRRAPCCFGTALLLPSASAAGDADSGSVELTDSRQPGGLMHELLGRADALALLDWVLRLWLAAIRSWLSMATLQCWAQPCGHLQQTLGTGEVEPGMLLGVYCQQGVHSLWSSWTTAASG